MLRIVNLRSYPVPIPVKAVRVGQDGVVKGRKILLVPRGVAMVKETEVDIYKLDILSERGDIQYKSVVEPTPAAKRRKMTKPAKPVKADKVQAEKGKRGE